MNTISGKLTSIVGLPLTKSDRYGSECKKAYLSFKEEYCNGSLDGSRPRLVQQSNTDDNPFYI